MNGKKIAFWKRASINFLSKVCQYEIKNANGDNHRIANAIDFIVLIIYMVITIAIIVDNQFTNLSYGVILISTIRMMLKHAKRITSSKDDNNGRNNNKKQVAITELVLTIIFAVGAVIYSVLFFTIDDYTKPWVIALFILYYGVNILLEVFDILISLFNAEPLVFTQEGRD